MQGCGEGPGLSVGLGMLLRESGTKGKTLGLLKFENGTNRPVANWTLLIPWQTERCPCFTSLLRVLLEVKEDVFGTASFCSL